MDIAPSVADRRPRPRKHGPKVGKIVDPFRCREIWFDSGLEQSHLLVLVADPSVREIREQQAIVFGDAGRKRTHFLDIQVVHEDGRRVAYSAKYDDQVTSELVRDLRLAHAQNGRAMGDEVRILTERDVSLRQIENARFVVDCGCDFDSEGLRHVRETLACMPRAVSFGRIEAASGIGERGYRAAVALVQAGCVTVPDNAVIDRTTEVVNNLSAATD